MRSAFAALAASLVSGVMIVACSSTPPDAPSTLEAPQRNRSPREGADDPPSSSNLASAEAGIGTSSSGGAAQCATVPPNNRCGLDPQCGCAMNETCDVTNEATGATSCVTGGSATLGRPCTQTGDCIAGLTCAYGACRPFCSTPRTKCNAPGTELCVEIPDANGKPLPNLNVCTVACDPFDPKGVCGTNSCHWFEKRYAPFRVSDCNYPGESKLKGACEGDSDCAQGLLCIAQKCEKWCRIGQAGDCPTTSTCQDYFGADAPVIGGVKRGVCLN